MLRAKNALPRISGLFSRATVQAVLLFSAEMWNVLTAMLAQLKGFHIRATYRIVHRHKPEWTPKGWVYPLLKDMLKEAGLHTMEYCIQVRRNTITTYIVHRPIFKACRERGRKRGSRPRQFWWDQLMELDRMRDTADAGPDFGGGEAAPL